MTTEDGVCDTVAKEGIGECMKDPGALESFDFDQAEECISKKAEKIHQDQLKKYLPGREVTDCCKQEAFRTMIIMMEDERKRCSNTTLLNDKSC